MPENHYLQDNLGSSETSAPMNITTTTAGDYLISTGSAWVSIPQGVTQIDLKKSIGGIHPELYFKYIKSKFRLMERMRLDRRLKSLERAVMVAIDNGQEALADKFLLDIAKETRESAIYAKGITKFIEGTDLRKHKSNIRGGHISDTRIRDYTRVIPPKIAQKAKELKGVFDDFVIFHYWDNDAEEKRAKKQKMSQEEKYRMRDPVLFGIIKETDRLYFIADWEDELCDLSFDEIVEEIGKETLTATPTLDS